MNHPPDAEARLRSEFGFQEILVKSERGMKLLLAFPLGPSDFVCWMHSSEVFQVMRFGSLSGQDPDWHDVAGKAFLDPEIAIHEARLIFEHQTLEIVPAEVHRI
jgi:hypothetical protein